MTSYAPTPEKPSRVRVRWDNVMIVLVVMAIVAFAGVAFILINAGRATDAPRPEGADTSPTTAVADEATADAGALDLDDARGLVDDARALMTEARWDEAAEHLALVPVDMRDQMDVASVEQELAEARELHEGFSLLNYGEPGQGMLLRPGMTIALEPMINAGRYGTKVKKDLWTVSTIDGKLSAHFEHTIAITDGEADVLTKLE